MKPVVTGIENISVGLSTCKANFETSTYGAKLSCPYRRVPEACPRCKIKIMDTSTYNGQQLGRELVFSWYIKIHDLHKYANGNGLKII